MNKISMIDLITQRDAVEIAASESSNGLELLRRFEASLSPGQAAAIIHHDALVGALAERLIADPLTPPPGGLH